MNYYEHHLGDFARDTLHLSMLEEGAYRRLLDAYYIRERALPGDVRECCKLARATAKAERDAVAYVLREFFQLRDDGLHHQTRADAEIARFQDKQAKARASAEKRWAHTERNANASPNAMRTHSEGTANGDANGMHRAPVPSPQTPNTNTPPSASHLAPPCKPATTGTRLPPGWTPPDSDAELALSLGFANGRAEAELAKFRDYWAARPGAGGRKLDWPATWRNWLRKAAETRPQRSAGAADEPAWRREQRERNEAFLGPFSASAAKRRRETLEAADAAPPQLG